MILRPFSFLQYPLRTAKSIRVVVLVLISSSFEPLMPTVSHYTTSEQQKFLVHHRFKPMESPDPYTFYFRTFSSPMSKRRGEYLHRLEILLPRGRWPIFRSSSSLSRVLNTH